MKIMTILGTRPEIIRLSLLIRLLDQHAAQHVLVHTGQNYVESLNDIFFRQLKIRKPDYLIHVENTTLGEQLSILFKEIEQVIRAEQPDRILILGDTNSGLCAIIAERLGIPVFHMEAGNRCFDLKVPEEKNRRVIDAISTYNLPYTKGSRENLLREGIPSSRIIVTGNPIFEVLEHYKDEINKSDILHKLNLKDSPYLLVTAHRAENVDDPVRLAEIFGGLHKIAERLRIRIICSVHPRTKDKISRFGVQANHQLITLSEPFGFFDFIRLQKSAACVITDSGTVQEESCLFHVPAVTIRDSTERPETIACGSNVISGLHAERIVECVKFMMSQKQNWSFPEGYTDLDVSIKVAKLLLGGIPHV